MASSSSRLRSRLAREEIDAAQASRVTENFVLIGTPLPSLDQRDPNEGKPVWEQEVRDEQGRRRFHGAFTGGWSAGYYNTVGSKEGWTPSAFVSSRKDRLGEKVQARPEDFMDEEDLAETDSTRKISQKDDYSNVARLDSRHADDDVLGDLLGLGRIARQQLQSAAFDSSESGLVAPKSSLGHRILARMGWKSGSGLGKPLQIGQPRRDTPMPLVAQGINKKDTHGLGWTDSAAGASSEPPQTLQMVMQSARRDVQPSQRGFDISVMEEADEDDVGDIFTSTESIQDVIRRRKDEQSKGEAPLHKAAGQPVVSLPRQQFDATRNTWRDGRPLPEGFVFASGSVTDGGNGQIQMDWFKPPSVPPGWKPNPLQVWSQAKGSSGPPPPVASTSAAPLGQPAIPPHHIKAVDRAQLLGEARIPGPPPSLANYLPDSRQTASSTAPSRPSITIPRIDAATARAALKGFFPFGNELEKQRRYISYLESQADPASYKDTAVLVQTGQSPAQLSQELEEFARSASIFKPLSTAMASRFATASSVEGGGDAHVPKGGLYQPEVKSRETIEEESKKKAKQEEERLNQEKEESMNDGQRAAKAGMFGHLTRHVKAWYPPRLLCKRFGVPAPHLDRARDGVPDDDNEDARRDEGSGSDRGRGTDPFNAAIGSGKEDRFARSEAKRELKRGEARWEKSKRELLSLAGERHWEGKGGQPIEGGGPAASEDSQSAVADANGAAALKEYTPLDLEQVGLGEDEAILRIIDAFVRPSRTELKSVFAPDEESDEAGQGEEQSVDAGRVGSTSDPQATQGEEVAPSRLEEKSAAPLMVNKPTFIPRSKRMEASDSSHVNSDSKKRKKKKDPKKAGGALTFSFDDEEGEDQGQWQGNAGKFGKKIKTAETPVEGGYEGAHKADVVPAESREPLVKTSAARTEPAQPSSDATIKNSGSSNRVKAADLF